LGRARPLGAPITHSRAARRSAPTPGLPGRLLAEASAQAGQSPKQKRRWYHFRSIAERRPCREQPARQGPCNPGCGGARKIRVVSGNAVAHVGDGRCVDQAFAWNIVGDCKVLRLGWAAGRSIGSSVVLADGEPLAMGENFGASAGGWYFRGFTLSNRWHFIPSSAGVRTDPTREMSSILQSPK